MSVSIYFATESHSDYNSANVSVHHSPDREEPGARHIKRGEELPPAPIDGIYDKWFFISGAAV